MTEVTNLAYADIFDIKVLWLTLGSILGWFISTVAGGGSSLLLMPLVDLLLGPASIPPIITIGAIFGNGERSFAYRNKIDWQVIFWELPASLVGACLGAFTLTQLRLEWLGILVALFLIVSALNYFFKKEQQSSWSIRAWYFLPAGFVYAFLSGIIGSMGSLLAPLYIGYGLEKEELLGTQALTRGVIHIVKAIAYIVFGALTLHHLEYGVILGLAAFPGNWLGNLALEKISEHRFRKLVFAFVLFSGLLILWQQLQLLFR